jgi:outer membrane protein OmpU
MRRVPALSAMLSTMLAVSPAVAGDDGTLVLKLNGHVSTVAAVIDQSNMDGLDEAALAIDSGLFASLSTRLDGGGQVGARVALDLDYATNFDTVLNDAGASDVLEEAWLFWDSRWGRLQMGLQDGAADVLALGVPSVSSSIRVDGPEIFLLGYPCRSFCSSESQEPGSLFSPSGMQLRSDIHGSDNYLKIMYVTPDLGGLRLAVSYTPDGTRDLGELFGADEPNEQGRIWDFAANYLRTIGEVDFGLSLGYVTGENVNKSLFFPFGDLEDWGGTLKLGYREWTFGTAYRQTNVSGGGPVVQGNFISNVTDGLYTDSWSFGLTYESGPWMLGANYIMSTQDVGFSVDQEGNGLQLAGAYTLHENLRLSAGYQRFEFKGPFNTCLTDFGGSFCDTLDGNVGYIETTFSF